MLPIKAFLIQSVSIRDYIIYSHRFENVKLVVHRQRVDEPSRPLPTLKRRRVFVGAVPDHRRYAAVVAEVERGRRVGHLAGAPGDGVRKYQGFLVIILLSFYDHLMIIFRSSYNHLMIIL